MTLALSMIVRVSVAESNDYLVQAGDVLEISLWREEDLDKELMVRPDGYFSFPLVGDVLAAGKTVENIRAEITEKINTFIPEPEVNVSLLSNQGNRIYIIGKVATPGAVILNHDVDVMQALSIAGGTTTFAKLNKILILRRNNGVQQSIPFRYGDIEKGENLEQNIILQQGDIIVVP